MPETHPLDKRLDGLLLHIGQHRDHHLATTLNHAKDRWPFLLQGAPATFTFESASTSFTSPFLHHLWLTFMAGNYISFVALNFL
jgi:hypothetical protein